MSLRVLTAVVAATFIFSSAEAETRSYAGGFNTRWNTVGWHGHDQPLCAAATTTGRHGSPAVDASRCNDFDFVRANLDNSIGFRAGRERDAFRHGPLQFTLGGEGTFVDSEYNLSQDHVTFFGLAAVAGIDYQLLGGRIGARYGVGPFLTTDDRWGLQSYAEAGATIPLRAGAGIRISYRTVAHLFRYNGEEATFGRPPSIDRGETSILFVADPQSSGPSRWEFSASAGTTAPGLGYGHGLSLRRAAWKRLAAMYATGSNELQVEASWTATAHESTVHTSFNGYPGNERGKTIESFGIGLRHGRTLSDLVSLHYGAGVEIADFEDVYQLLIRDGEDVLGGLEYGVRAGAALRIPVVRQIALEGGLEHIYWPGIDLGEVRWGIAFVITR